MIKLPLKNKIINRYRVTLPDHEVLQLHRNARPELYNDSIISSLRMNLPLMELSRYPDIESFLPKLSNFINIDRENILLTSGIDGAIKIIFETFTRPMSKVALLTPTYKMYEVYAEAYSINLTEIKSLQNLTIDINEILDIIPNIEILFIPNPHEPVENVFSREQILKIIETAAAHGVIVVIDEAYFLFGAPTVIDLAPQSSNLLVMRSFSKGFGLPAIRLGYTIGNKELISHMTSRRVAYETNSLSIWVAEWALSNFDLFDDYIEEVISTRSFIRGQLQDRGFEVHGSYSNTILINLSSKDNALKVHKKLKEENIWVRELTNFPNVDTWISVTIGKKSTAAHFLKTFFSITN